MLLALVSAQRAQTLHYLNIDNVNFKTDSVEMFVDKLLKQSRLGNIGMTLELNAYSQDKRVCHVHYLRQYIRTTTDIRKTERYLFVTY